MQIPNLPTDSLYKFMAISGLLLYLLGILLPRFLTDDLRQKSDELSLEIDLVSFEIEKAIKKRKDIESDLSRLNDLIIQYSGESNSIGVTQSR